MNPQDPTFQDLPDADPLTGGDCQAAGAEVPLVIELGEVPAPRLPAALPEGSLHEPIQVPIPASEVAPAKPPRFRALREWFGRGYFDPAKAFEDEVDWARFGRAQLFLFLLSLAAPFLMLLVFGCLFGLIYAIGASLYAVSAPNAIHEVMIYPLVFVLARGYWLSYLALPIAMYLIGWIWAVLAAGVLSLGEEATMDFKRGLAILAMFAAMMAPFALLPFLRFVALILILRLLAKRMEDTFGTSVWRLSARAGLILLGSGLLYAAFARKVEEIYPAGETLRANLDSFVRANRKLEWPAFRTRLPIHPGERLLEELSDFDSQVRERAIKKGLAVLELRTETPELRYRLAKRLADNGQVEAYLHLARYLATGQGTEPDLPLAIEWMKKYTEANPAKLDIILEKAKLFFLAGRRLEGKVTLVQAAKAQPRDLKQIATFIGREQLG